MKTWRTKLGGAEFKVMRFNDAPAHEMTLDNPAEIAAYLRQKLLKSLLYRPDVENLIVVHLNARAKPIGFEVAINGLLDQLLAHPREVFRSAIVMNSHAIVLATQSSQRKPNAK